MNYADAREFWGNILNATSISISRTEIEKLTENFIRFCGWKPDCRWFSSDIRDWTFTRIYKAKDKEPVNFSYKYRY